MVRIECDLMRGKRLLEAGEPVGAGRDMRRARDRSDPAMAEIEDSRSLRCRRPTISSISAIAGSERSPARRMSRPAPTGSPASRRRLPRIESRSIRPRALRRLPGRRLILRDARDAGSPPSADGALRRQQPDAGRRDASDRGSRVRLPCRYLDGVDDLSWASAFRPRLTTVRQPVREMGLRRCAFSSTGPRPSAGPAKRLVLQPTLIVRESWRRGRDASRSAKACNNLGDRLRRPRESLYTLSQTRWTCRTVGVIHTQPFDASSRSVEQLVRVASDLSTAYETQLLPRGERDAGNIRRLRPRRRVAHTVAAQTARLQPGTACRHPRRQLPRGCRFRERHDTGRCGAAGDDRRGA